MGTWYVSIVRRSFLGFLSELDEEDDLGLQGMIHYLESLGVGFGTRVADEEIAPSGNQRDNYLMRERNQCFSFIEPSVDVAVIEVCAV